MKYRTLDKKAALKATAVIACPIAGIIASVMIWGPIALVVVGMAACGLALICVLYVWWRSEYELAKRKNIVRD